MDFQSSIRAVAVAFSAALLMTIGGAQAHDATKYPNLKGQWSRFVVPGLPASPLTTRPRLGEGGNKRRLRPNIRPFLRRASRIRPRADMAMPSITPGVSQAGCHP